MTGHFVDLEEPVRGRLATRGIDIEHSCEALLDDCLVTPPPDLLAALAAAPVLTEQQLPLPRPRRPRNGDSLSEREVHVLLLIADGLENSEIAVEINVGVETVKTNVKALLVKLDARNRAHAVALAYHRGVLVPREAR